MTDYDVTANYSSYDYGYSPAPEPPPPADSSAADWAAGACEAADQFAADNDPVGRHNAVTVDEGPQTSTEPTAEDPDGGPQDVVDAAPDDPDPFAEPNDGEPEDDDSNPTTNAAAAEGSDNTDRADHSPGATSRDSTRPADHTDANQNMTPTDGNTEPNASYGSPTHESPAPAAGVEIGVAGQVFIGAEVKAGYFADADDNSALTLTVGARAGWSFGFTAGADGVVAPGGISSVSGGSIAGEVDVGVASTSVSTPVGPDGPGTPYVTVSPPGAGVGAMVGATSSASYTVTLPLPRLTGEQAAAVMNTVPLP